MSHVEPRFMPESTKLDAALSIDLVRVVEAAAIAAARLAGHGDEKAADAAAANAMRAALRQVSIQGKVIVGDGPRGAVPALYIGEAVGAGGVTADVIVDPLECISRAARSGPDSLSLIAIGAPGAFLPAPPVYMEKLSVGPAAANAAISLGASPEDNVRAVAAALGKQASEVTVCVLDRPRHANFVQSIRSTGARVRLIGDGDIVGALLPSLHETGVDIYFGTGGAPEGVFAAAALRGLGGRILGRLTPRNDDERGQLNAVGITDTARTYTTEDLAAGDVIFAAAGVTPGALLDAAHIGPHHADTHSVVIRSRTGSVRWIKTHHRLDESGNLRLGN